MTTGSWHYFLHSALPSSFTHLSPPVAFPLCSFFQVLLWFLSPVNLGIKIQLSLIIIPAVSQSSPYYPYTRVFRWICWQFMKSYFDQRSSFELPSWGYNLPDNQVILQQHRGFPGSPVVKISTPNAEGLASSLVRELGSHMPPGQRIKR